MDRHHSQFLIQASTAESMAESLNLPSVLHLLPHLVPSAMSLARPPISNFPVAAVGLGSDGRVFIGVNLEFPGVPLHHSVHAEQFLVTNLLAHGCPRLVSVAVSAAPCGHCRQFLQELRHSSASLQILVLDDEQHARVQTPPPNFKSLSKFLPNPFGPHDLLHQDIPLLLENQDNQLNLIPQNHPNSDNICNGNLTNGNLKTFKQNETLMKKSAFEAANNSHSPYSGCPSGVALMDSEGNVYKGSYIESAAYNPSLGPVQAALVAFVAGASGASYDRIVAAALVENEAATVRQEDTARLFLKAISPECDFQAFYCQPSG